MTPREEYQRRQGERQQQVDQLDRSHYRVGNARLVTFLALLLVLVLLVAKTLSSGWWLVAPAALFLVLADYHNRLTQLWERARRAVRFYQEGLNRLDFRWMGQGLQGSRYLQDQHPYGRDLDLFGPNSLFELLCLARTRPGEDCLAAWLCQGQTPPELAKRRQALEELAPRLELREELASLYGARSTLSAPAIGDWGKQPLRFQSSALRLLARVLGLLGAASILYWLWRWDPRWMLAMVPVQGAFLRWPAAPLKQLLRELEPIRRDLHCLVLFLARLEQERFQSPLLSELAQQWQPSASSALRDLDGWIELLDSRRNPLLGPLMFLTLAHLQLAFAVENWRHNHGAKVTGWLEALAQFEALSSLANFHWENPDYVWPEWGEGLVARQLGHPLLGPSCVGNDVDLRTTPLWVVSGSNMSGKSSLLRAVGTNLVLAMAGAPVRAQSFTLEPLQIGASIQLADSLAGGISRFYAEILRLRQVVEMAGIRPRLLFLLDEIMAGTNSHDRRIGAEAILRRLVEEGALGLVTTHDLALTLIADDLAPRAANVHFEDQLEEGKMSFDYHLRPGPVARSNALELMRAVGLEV